jgi:hypothetical protein
MTQQRQKGKAELAVRTEAIACSAFQMHGPRWNLALEALELDFAGIRELQILADTEVRHDVGHQHLAGIRLGAEPRGELDG